MSCATGYSGSDGTVACVGNSQNGDQPQVSITCTENACSPIDLGTQLVGDDTDPCSQDLRLTTHSDTTCNVRCHNGYEGPGGTFTCSADADDDDAPTQSVSCAEIFCDAYVLPSNVVGGDTDPCSNAIQLSTHTDTSCNVKCQSGYSGTPTTISCPIDASSGQSPIGSISCTENYCEAYEFDVSVTQGSTDPCQNGVPLSTHTDNYCTIQCNTGFNGDEGYVTCSSTSDSNAAPMVRISCVANTCEAILLPDSLVPDLNAEVPCENGLVLNTQSENLCSVQCAPGYRGNGGTIECSASASNGDPVTPQTDCVQNVCLPFNFGSAYVTASSLSACTDSIRLSSNEECVVSCAVGYDTTSQTGQTTVKCALDASNNEEATALAPCTELMCPSVDYAVGVTGASTSDGCSMISELSAVTNPSCRLACSVGYTYQSGDEFQRCSKSGDLIANNFTCRENACAPLSLGPGEVGSGQTPCTDNLVLNTATSPTGCTYRNAQNESMIAVCSRDSNDGDNVTIELDDSNQLRCQSFSFDSTVYQSSESNGCYSGIELSSVSDPSCNVECVEGTTGTGGTLTCNTATSYSGVPLFQANCTENECVLPTNLNALNLQVSQDSDACDMSGTLTTRTNTSCTMKCADGLYGYGTFTCPDDALHGTQAVVSVECSEVTCNE